MGDAKRVDEMMRDAANDLAMPQPGPQALAYAQQMLRIGAASIEAAKRVDLDMLRKLTQYAKGLDRDVLDDAIEEIEAARAAPAPPVASPLPGVLASLTNTAVHLARSIVDEMARGREAGPSRAARLVAYRCAALPSVLDVPLASFSNGETPVDVAENVAHAMLAAEREPQS